MLVHPHFRSLAERVRLAPPVRAGFVFPCDRDALQLALSGAFAGFCDPVFVGPEARIREVADGAGLDIARIPIANTPDLRREAVMCALELARAGKIRMMVKGELLNEELLAPLAAPESGLRSDRRLSYAAVVDLPERPHPILLADPLLNIAPNLAAKRDILLNTLDLARALGATKPRVAVLAALPTANHAFPSTLDAAALGAMSLQGMFGDALVQGPVTPDAAFAPRPDRGAALGGAVTRDADVLLAPDMEGASLLLRTILVLTGGFAAGIVVGARVPIVVPTRHDPMEVRMGSCVLAALQATAAARTPGASSAPALAGTPAGAQQQMPA